ncbi:hypothetical protein Avbf_15767 [Armadillidium vulgare]|nr:hypothetical protein Avbf_15767 [Armadillidium vulgare]
MISDLSLSSILILILNIASLFILLLSFLSILPTEVFGEAVPDAKRVKKQFLYQKVSFQKNYLRRYRRRRRKQYGSRGSRN